MAKGTKPTDAAIGFRVKSGWATAVLLGGAVDAPRVLDRCVVELSDPDVPETRQPYHASTGREETDAARIRRRVTIVERVASRSLKELLTKYRQLDGRVRGAALVVGSVIDPESIANPHIRAHACEGRLFRTVLERALSARGVRSRVLLERSAYAEAAAAIGQSPAVLKRKLLAMGRSVGRPWGANEKLAALAAWTTMA